MKQLLLILIVLTPFLTIGQESNNNISSKEKIEIESFLKNRKTSSYFDNKISFVNIVYNLYSTNLKGFLQPIFPDSAIIIKENIDNDTIYYYANKHAVGNVNHLEFTGFQNAYTDGYYSIDTVLVSGKYQIFNSAHNRDSLKVSLFSYNYLPFDSSFTTSYWQPGTFPNLNPLDTVHVVQFRYKGMKSNGYHNGLKATLIDEFYYELSSLDTGGIKVFKFPTFSQYYGSQEVGCLIEFIPTDFSVGDTIDFTKNIGSVNAFRVFGLKNASLTNTNAYFLEFHKQTTNNSMNFIDKKTRYSLHSNLDSIKNHKSSINPYLAWDIYYHVSGSSNINENLNNHYSLFPNPNNGSFKLKLFKNINKSCTLELYNNIGQLAEKQLVNLNGQNEIDIQLNDHGSGIYYVILRNESFKAVEKLIIN